MLRRNGQTIATYELSYTSLAYLVSDMQDKEENADLFRILAEHPASDVRENVACKDSLDEETIEILSSDPSPSVLRNLVGRTPFRHFVLEERLLELMEADPEIAESVAQNVEAYDNVEVTRLAKALARTLDPQVRFSLASNMLCPKSVLRSLANDADPIVCREARARLEDE